MIDKTVMSWDTLEYWGHQNTSEVFWETVQCIWFGNGEWSTAKTGKSLGNHSLGAWPVWHKWLTVTCLASEQQHSLASTKLYHLEIGSKCVSALPLAISERAMHEKRKFLQVTRFASYLRWVLYKKNLCTLHEDFSFLIVPEMTYYVSGGTLNLNRSLQSGCHQVTWSTTKNWRQIGNHNVSSSKNTKWH